MIRFAEARLPDVHAEKFRNLARQGTMRASGKQLQLPTTHSVVGAEGFEPSNTGSKVPRLTAWPRPIIRPTRGEAGQPPRRLGRTRRRGPRARVQKVKCIRSMR